MAVADPAPGAAERLAASLGADRAYTDPAEAFADPAVDAVVIAAPARFHADLVVAAAARRARACSARSRWRCRWPTPTGPSRPPAPPVSCCRSGSTGGSPPTGPAARGLLDDGRLGTPRLLRSVTRDPGGFDPARVAPDTIFKETLIHDFDALRFLNPGAEAVEVYATADALVEPDWRDRGLLDTASVVVRFDNGAIGVGRGLLRGGLWLRRAR